MANKSLAPFGCWPIDSATLNTHDSLSGDNNSWAWQWLGENKTLKTKMKENKSQLMALSLSDFRIDQRENRPSTSGTKYPRRFYGIASGSVALVFEFSRIKGEQDDRPPQLAICNGATRRSRRETGDA
jgi:hypothetical protein